MLFCKYVILTFQLLNRISNLMGFYKSNQVLDPPWTNEQKETVYVSFRFNIKLTVMKKDGLKEFFRAKELLWSDDIPPKDTF